MDERRRYTVDLDPSEYKALRLKLAAGEGIRLRAGFSDDVRLLLLGAFEFRIFKDDLEDEVPIEPEFDDEGGQFEFTWTAPSDDTYRLVVWNESGDGRIEGAVVLTLLALQSPPSRLRFR